MNKLLVFVPLAIVYVHIVRLAAAQNDEGVYTFPQNEGEYKYVAALTSKAGVCTAVIINKYYVLTAAHCLFSRGRAIGDKDAKVHAGTVNYEKKSNRKREIMSDRIHIHPRFWENRVAKFDVALVFLSYELEFSDDIGSINISAEGWPQRDGPNNTVECMALGFGGYRSTAPPSRNLKVWNVTADHGEDACGPCVRRFQYKRLVCVKEMAYPHLCKGDDGGPLVCGDVVVGVGHMVWDTNDCDSPTYPQEKCDVDYERGVTTYTYLCPLNNWLRSIVPELPPTPASCRAALPSRAAGVAVAAIVLFMLFWI